MCDEQQYLLYVASVAEEILAEAQAGFRANRNIIDQIFTLRQLAEKYDEFGKELYTSAVSTFGKLLIVCGARDYGRS